VGTDYFGLIDYPAVRGLEDIAKIPSLYKILLKKGMTERDIEMMSYKNSLRVLERTAALWA